MELAGNFALEGYSPRLAMDCSLWKDFPSLPDFLLICFGDKTAELLDGLACLPRLRSDSGFRYGLCYGPSNNFRFARYYWVGSVSALPRSFTVTTAHSCNFLRIPKFVGFCKLLPVMLLSGRLVFSTTSVRVPRWSMDCKGGGC